MKKIISLIIFLNLINLITIKAQYFEEGQDVYVANSSDNINSFADIDNDGDDDLLISNYSDSSCLFLNENGSFIQQNTCFDVDEFHQWIYFNKDTLIDLFSKKGVYLNTGNYNFDFYDLDSLSNGQNDLRFFKGVGDFDSKGNMDLITISDTNYKLHLDTGFFNYEIIDLSLELTSSTLHENVSVIDFNQDGLTDIFVTNNGERHLFENKGSYVFELVQSFGLNSSVGSIVDVSWIDIDNDGDLDLFNLGYFEENQVFINNSNNSFSEIEMNNITDYSAGNQSHSWADIDDDGDLDLFISRVRDVSSLYINNNGAFEISNNEPMINTESLSCVFFNLDNNNFPDLMSGGIVYNNFLLTTNVTNSFSNDFEFWPNPIDNFLYLKANQNNYEISIIDISGYLIFKESLTQGINHVNLGELKNGVYSLKIINNSDVQTHKLIKE